MRSELSESRKAASCDAERERKRSRSYNGPTSGDRNLDSRGKSYRRPASPLKANVYRNDDLRIYVYIITFSALSAASATLIVNKPVVIHFPTEHKALVENFSFLSRGEKQRK